jgi:hypothetical protein
MKILIVANTVAYLIVIPITNTTWFIELKFPLLEIENKNFMITLQKIFQKL